MLYEFELQDNALSEVVNRLSHELQHPDHMLLSIGDALLTVNNKRHLESKAPDGTPWAPLKESSKKDKRKGGPLVKTSEMIDRLIYQVDSNRLKLGFDGKRNADLASWHHNGTDPYIIEPLNRKALKFGNVIVKRVKHPGLPARPLLGMPQTDKDLMASVINDHLLYVLSKK